MLVKKSNFHYQFFKSNPLKKLFFFLTFVSSAFYCSATNYYFSSSTGNDSYSSAQAQNQATPWNSIAKLNSFFNSILPGDNIYFKRGDVFYGCIYLTRSGSSTSNITFSAYGTGNKPVISGFTTLSGWALVGTGIYEAAAPTVTKTVNILTMNGLPQVLGRYPNATDPNGGYLTYESFSGTSITDNQLTGATNWTGAEVVMRKQHFSLEKGLITSHSNSVINYTTTPTINPSSNGTAPAITSGISGYGYFIQRDARTLDQLGEWYFNPGTKKMRVFFGANSPTNYTVQTGALDTLLYIGSQKYININNIAFEGANRYAINANNSGNITIQSCDMNSMGGKGVFIWNSPNTLVDGLSTNNLLCNAIDLNSKYQNNSTIRNCSINNTGTIAGMGSFWDDNDYKAISVSINSGALVEYNSITNTGFVGIQFQGDNVTIRNNFINNYDLVKDDGGGIYTYQSGRTRVYTNRLIQNNIILNGIGASAGTGGNIDVDGIFLDGQSMNVNIFDNTLANIGVNGIYSNNAENVNIRGNTSFNNGCGIGITRYSYGSIINLTVKKNIFYSKTNAQGNFDYVNTGVNMPVVSTIQAEMQKIGLIDSNYYSMTNATGFSYRYKLLETGGWTFAKPMSYEGWRSMSNHDRGATALPKIPSYKLNSLTSANTFTSGQFTSNISGMTVWSATPNMVPSWDNTGKINGGGSLKLTPLLPSTDFTLLYGNVGALSSSKKYILRFTTLGTANNGVVKAYLRQSGGAKATLTPIQITNFGTSKTVQEFMFSAPTSEAAASFLIEVQQSAGTVYIDDIEFYEADATVLDIDSQLRFEFNASSTAKTVTLDASYKGTDNTIYNGSITLQPYTSKILLRSGPATAPTPPPPAQTFTATATAPAINCFGGSTTALVSATGGTAPYTGAGSFVVNAGKGSLKIAVPNPAARASTLLYSPVGAISSSKNYVLRFSTLGTTNAGSIKVYLRQTKNPYATLTPVITKTFGTTRVDHEFLFTAPTTEAAASFLIDLAQSSGTTYFDNIAFFEASSTGVLLSNNLYNTGQLENGISGITAWSVTSNHIASFDQSGKISNTYYYLVKDAGNASAVAVVKTIQPTAALLATATAPGVTVAGGTTTVVVAATGGSAPYTGTGSFPNIKVGSYNYTVTDAKGCTSTVAITVSLTTGRVAASTSTTDTSLAINAQRNTLEAVNTIELKTLKISTYPNPTNTQFKLQLEGGTNEPVNISVFSIDGKVVYTTRGTSNKTYLFGNSFLPGLYMVKVIQNNTVQTLKVIKIK